METVSSQRVPRSPKCARCRNHGFVVALKGHAGHCRFSRCSCWKCALITERTRIMATQRAIKKRQRAKEHERGARDTGNGISGGDPVLGVAKCPARETDTEDKTYTELEVAAQTGSADDPEIAQKSSDHSRGTRNSAIYREQLKMTETPRNHTYPSELPLAMPFYLHPYYTNAFIPPPFLLRFGAPPPGAVGFPPPAQSALSESALSESALSESALSESALSESALSESTQDGGTGRAALVDLRGSWSSERSDECFEIRGRCSVFSFVGERQCFKSDTCSYWKPVEGVQQRGCLFREIEHSSSSYFLNHPQRAICLQRKTEPEASVSRHSF